MSPAAFDRAVNSLRSTPLRQEIVIREIPAPQRLAPYSFAVAADVISADQELGGGQLILLHDPAAPESWGGVHRLVTYITADLEREIVGDPLLGGVGWSWLLEALSTYDAGYTAASGTVTATVSTRFEQGADPVETATVELRASWTPLGDDLGPHLLAWSDVLCTTAGLPPPGVRMLPPRGVA